MPCDLQKLLASAADLPAATAPREPSIGERLLQDMLRLDAEMDKQRRLDRAAALGYYGWEMPAHTLDALELIRRTDEANAQAERYERLSRGLPPTSRPKTTSLFDDLMRDLTHGSTDLLRQQTFPREAEDLSFLARDFHRPLGRPAAHLHIHVHPNR